MVGQEGLEASVESYLTGKRGGVLYLIGPEGQTIRKLAEAPSEPAQDVYATLERDFQAGVQRAISDYRAAAVVLERDTGRVLAMASSPSFDPNAWAPGNNNAYTQLSELGDPSQPLYNRATRGLYPLGSVFKIITIAAALESGLFTPETTYECGYVFEELPGFPRYDWTWEKFQEDEETQPSGLLTLPEGLIRSCNPYFWHMGLKLFDQGLTTAVSDMARGFGLDSETGLESLAEEAGNIRPMSRVDAINLAIGQGKRWRLRVASCVAAVRTAAPLYTPTGRPGCPARRAYPGLLLRGELPIGQNPRSSRMRWSVAQHNRGTALEVCRQEIAVSGKPVQLSRRGTRTPGSPGTLPRGRRPPGHCHRGLVENTGEIGIRCPDLRRIVSCTISCPASSIPEESLA
jgi:penicillin-binding protein 2